MMAMFSGLLISHRPHLLALRWEDGKHQTRDMVLLFSESFVYDIKILVYEYIIVFFQFNIGITQIWQETIVSTLVVGWFM